MENMEVESFPLSLHLLIDTLVKDVESHLSEESLDKLYEALLTPECLFLFLKKYGERFVVLNLVFKLSVVENAALELKIVQTLQLCVCPTYDLYEAGILGQNFLKPLHNLYSDFYPDGSPPILFIILIVAKLTKDILEIMERSGLESQFYSTALNLLDGLIIDVLASSFIFEEISLGTSFMSIVRSALTSQNQLLIQKGVRIVKTLTMVMNIMTSPKMSTIENEFYFKKARGVLRQVFVDAQVDVILIQIIFSSSSSDVESFGELIVLFNEMLKSFNFPTERILVIFDETLRVAQLLSTNSTFIYENFFRFVLTALQKIKDVPVALQVKICKFFQNSVEAHESNFPIFEQFFHSINEILNFCPCEALVDSVSKIKKIFSTTSNEAMIEPNLNRDTERRGEINKFEIDDFLSFIEIVLEKEWNVGNYNSEYFTKMFNLISKYGKNYKVIGKNGLNLIINLLKVDNISGLLGSTLVESPEFLKFIEEEIRSPKSSHGLNCYTILYHLMVLIKKNKLRYEGNVKISWSLTSIGKFLTNVTDPVADNSLPFLRFLNLFLETGLYSPLVKLEEEVYKGGDVTDSHNLFQTTFQSIDFLLINLLMQYEFSPSLDVCWITLRSLLKFTMLKCPNDMEDYEICRKDVAKYFRNLFHSLTISTVQTEFIDVLISLQPHPSLISTQFTAYLDDWTKYTSRIIFDERCPYGAGICLKYEFYKIFSQLHNWFSTSTFSPHVNSDEEFMKIRKQESIARFISQIRTDFKEYSFRHSSVRIPRRKKNETS